MRQQGRQRFYRACCVRPVAPPFYTHLGGVQLTSNRRISQGHSNLVGTRPIALLKDMDQPFVFEASFGRQQYRLEFYDTSSPENWRLLRPDLVLICYDISQRLSLINLQRVVRGHRSLPPSASAPPSCPAPN